MPRRRTRSGDLPTAAEINVTSLVDVAFTLLVIFLITAPILQGGVEVRLPRAQAAPLTAPDDGLVVSIDRTGQLFVGEAPVTWAEFNDAFPRIVRERGVGNVYLRADEGVPYGQVLRVLGRMKALDVASVGLVAEPEEE